VIGLACCCAGLLSGPVRADDWPQWRGPQRDGHVPGFAAPKVWPKQLERQWQVEVGVGHSSPVVVGNQVFVFTRQDEKEVVQAIRLVDGKEQWSQSYAAPYKVNPVASAHGKGPKSTPAVAGGRVVTLGINGILSCWDAASGKSLWQHEFWQYKATSPLYGTATSPLVDGGLAIAFVGGHNQGALAAFDVATGAARWKWDGDGPGCASPVLATLRGTRQLITQSQDACIGISPGDGTLLWSLPFKTDYEQNIITPVVAGDLLIFSGIGKGTSAYRMKKAGGEWRPERVWLNEKVSMYMSTPVAVGKCLFGLATSGRGQFFCLDLADGKTLWTSDGRMGENAAVLSAGEVLLALTTNAELLAFKPDPTRFEVLARYKVADTPTWAHPAIVGRRILIKDQTSLALWAIEE